MSYAVTWSEDAGPAYAGQLELADGEVVLSGSASRRLSYAEIADVYLERQTQPTLVLVTTTDAHLQVASLEGLGALHELADRIMDVRGNVSVPSF